MKKSVLRKLFQNFACLLLLASASFTVKGQADSKGTDFWVMFSDNAADFFTPTMSLFITGDENTTGTVSIPGIGFSAPFSVTAGTVTTVVLPAASEVVGSDVVSNKGINIKAAKEVIQEFEIENPDTSGIHSFTLVNADTNEDIQPLRDGDVIDQSMLPTTNLNIRVDLNPPQAGSVYMFLNGKRHIEHTAPYTLFANEGNDYNAGLLPIGHHTLSATPYSGKWGTGTKGIELKINFTVIGHKVTQFVLVNADTDEDIGPIMEGDVIDLVLLPAENFNIRADLNYASKGSVVFFLNGKKTIEHNAFFALFGNNGGDYYPGTLPVGMHTISATPYTKNYGQGIAGGELKVSFEIVGEKGIVDSKSSTKLAVGQKVAMSTYPNPARDLAKLDFRVAANERTVVEVYDLKGMLVTQLFNEDAVAGQEYSVSVDVGRLGNGVYLCRLTSGNQTLTKRLIVAR